MNRICSRCKKELAKPGRYLCPACEKQYYQEYRDRNRDKINAYQNARRDAIRRGKGQPVDGRRSWQGMDPRDEMDGYIQIARYIIKSQIRHYKSTLRKYARGKVEEADVLAIERELCSLYYAILTLHAVDLPALCRSMREEIGVNLDSDKKEVKV